MDTRINKTVRIDQLFNPELLALPKTGEGSLTVAQVCEEFRHIPLTDHEAAVALMDAYRKKAAQMDAEAKKAACQRHKEEVMKMWTAEECYNYALERGRIIGEQRGFRFQLDSDNAGVFELLSLYFANDPRFEEHDYFGRPYDLKKGICLLSPVRGNGKTTLLDCFMWNKRGCFTKMSTKQMARDYERGGLDMVERFMWLLPVASGASTFYQTHIGIHYDDFADEPEALYMGNRKLISAMIINSIYDDHRDTPMFHRFHVSMNYKWSEFEQRFGSNPASRMEELFNLIPVPGESRR